MAASNSVLHPRKLNPFCHNYYDPLCFAAPKSNRGALNYLPSSKFSPTLRWIKSPISSNSLNFTSTTKYRQFPAIIRASSEKSSENDPQINSSSPPKTMKTSHQQLLHHFSLRMILDIITFIWRLPGFIVGFIKNEEKVLDTVEDDIIEAANAVKVGAKVVEEVAQGLENVAESLEKASKTLDKDAKKVDVIMDEVKEKTKIAHDELEEVVGSLKGPVQDMEKDVAKVKGKESKEDTTSSLTTTNTPPSLATTVDPSTESASTLHYKPFQDSILIWRPQILLHSFLDLLQWPLVHVNFESPSYLMTLPRVFFGTMIVVSFALLLCGITNTPLVNYAH